MASIFAQALKLPIIGRVRRYAHRFLLNVANLCDPTADLGALGHVESQVFTPRSLGAPLSNLRYLFVGLCQIGYLNGSVARHGHTVDHVLYDSSSFGVLPPMDIERYDAAVVGLTLRTLLNEASSVADLTHAQSTWTLNEASAVFDRCLELIDVQLDRLHAALDAVPVFVFSFLEPSFNYLGLLQPALDVDHPAVFVRRLNEALARRVADRPNFHFHDLNEAFNTVGRLHLHDDVVASFSHACIIGSFDDALDRDRLVAAPSNHRLYDVVSALPVLQRYVFRSLDDAVKILRGTDQVKLIVVDLDDTLWRGVAADTDMVGWARVEGWPLGFAEALLFFKKRGGLLAICSKNDYDATVERFAAIWGERLRLSDFVSVKINWEAKSDSIAAILGEVNILPEQALFIDDNPRELAEVGARFPTLRRLGGNHRDWRRIILRSAETQVATVSEESSRRTELVRSRIERDFTPSALDRAAWLVSLNLRQEILLIPGVGAPRFERAFELLNKTNQFNTTGRRWSLAEIERFFKGGGQCLAASLRDDSMDNGLICVALITSGEIVQVVLSCRVFGLGAEAAMGSVATALALTQARPAVAVFVPTGANLSCGGYFEALGFTRAGDRYQATTAPAPPSWIALSLDRSLQAALNAARAVDT